MWGNPNKCPKEDAIGIFLNPFEVLTTGEVSTAIDDIAPAILIGEKTVDDLVEDPITNVKLKVAIGHIVTERLVDELYASLEAFSAVSL